MRPTRSSRRRRALAALATVFAFLVPAEPAFASDGGTTNPGTAQKNSLSPFQTVTQAGDYAVDGTGMRGTGAGVITIAGIPAGSTVTHAYLYWALLDTAFQPNFDNGVFNGTPITGTSIGTDTDPCWLGTGGTTFAFRADVTSLVAPGGNGAYALTGFASGAVFTPLAEGATLVVLYTDPAAIENRDIVIYNGADTIDETVASVSTTMTIPPIGVPGNAKTTYVVADGQVFTDETLFNGNVIAVNGFDGSDGPLWDTDTFNVTPFVSPGDTSVVVGLRRGSDCLSHVAQVFSASSSRVLPKFLVLDPPAFMNPVDSQHCVTATVTGFFGQPAAGVVVRFTVTGSVNTSGTDTTDASGEAEFCYMGPPLPGGDTIRAYADTDNDAVQDANEPAGVATKTWVLPVSTPGCEIKITNGGWIIAANGDRASFGGNAKVDADGNVSGQEEYQDHGPATPFNLHGNVLVVVCGSDGISATIFGQATIDGAGSHTYRIDVRDVAEPGRGFDHYRMRVNAYDSGDQVLQGGNVQVHRG